MTDVKSDYPARYYASYDTKAAQPTRVTGWYDTWDMSSLADVPPASSMIVVTEAQWSDPAFHAPIGKGVKNGVIVDFKPDVPLATQASYALSSARNYVQNNYTILNEATPDKWVTYLKALMAIANGTDTTSTELPTAPAE